MNKIKLKDIASIEAGQGAPQEKNVFGNVGYPFIRAGHLESLIKDRNYIQQIDKITEENAKKYKLKLFPKGTILFAKSGMSCMKGWVYVIPENCYVVSHLACVNSAKFSNNFLKYYFLYEKPNKLITDESYPSISLASISDLLIPNYDLQTQQKIVEELDCLSDIIEKKKQQLADLDNLIKSQFIEMFGNSINGWKFNTKKLVMLGQFKSGGTPDRKKMDVYLGDIPWITTIALGKSFIDSNDAQGFISNKAIEESATCLMPANSLMIGTRVGVGKSSINKIPMCMNQDIICMYGINSVNVLFLKYVIDDYKYLFDKNRKGATILGVTSNFVKDLDVPLPPTELQNKFADFVKNIEKLKLELKQSIVETQNLFNERMQHYFGD